MKLNSKVVAIIVLVVMFGGMMATTYLGWWQTEGGGRGNGNHNGSLNESPPDVTILHGTVTGYNQRELSVITDDRQSLYIELGNLRYNQSIGFAPQVGERVTIKAFVPGNQDLYSAITVTFDGTDRIYAFRDALGHPLWSGGNGNRN